MNPLSAIGAINQSGGLSGVVDTMAGLASAAAAPTGSAAFVEALGNAARNVVNKLEGAESLSLEALQGGEIQTRDVVDSVMSAEQSLQAAIAIRDKVVSAYLEVSRMAI
ncbi:MAG TPA: flagellar hook-basal body complex protein FliE [Rhizobiaceae bacterium]|nr:flagellar hook-basal body complex protein FliE [Rhizobiaceae bacterium]